jgi:hypothetical protein
MIQAICDIACISMTIEHDGIGVSMGYVPAVEPDPVFGEKITVLYVQAQALRFPITRRVFDGKKDKSVLKHG